MNPQINQLTSELENLLAKRQEITHLVENAPERMKPSFETAVANAGLKVGEFIARQDVSESVALLEEQRNLDCEVILNLQSSGLLTEEQAASQLEGLFNHEDYSLLRYVMSIGSTSLVGSDTTVVEVSVAQVDSVSIPNTTVTATIAASVEDHDTSATGETELSKIPTLLTVIERPGGKELKVGRTRGKRYKFSKSQIDQKDYTEERLKVLETLVAANGEEVRVKDIQDILSESGLIELTQVRSWFNSIKFMRFNLIETNNKRGLASAYKINPNLDVTIQYRKVESQKTRTTTTEKNQQQRTKKGKHDINLPDTRVL